MVTPLVSPKILKQQLPLKQEGTAHIEQSRNTISSLLKREETRRVLAIGPCSIHHADSAIEYGLKLKELALDVADQFFLVMRVFIEKPRSSLGWRGFLYDPHLRSFIDKDHSLDASSLQEGLYESRKLLLELTRLKIPIALEFLDPLIAPYFADLVSWGFIGARTIASPIHRQLASSLSMPLGLKNSVDGSIDSAIQAMLFAQKSHTFFSINEEGQIASLKSCGNEETYLVLRGGESCENCSTEKLLYALEALEKNQLKRGLVVDCAHGNSQKDHRKQTSIFQKILKEDPIVADRIGGLMLESHLEEGSQLPSDHPDPRRSITDSCLGWDETRSLVHFCAV